MTNIKDFSSAKSGKVKQHVTITTRDGHNIHHSGEKIQPLIEENGWFMVVELSVDEEEGFPLTLIPRENIGKVHVEYENV